MTLWHHRGGPVCVSVKSTTLLSLQIEVSWVNSYLDVQNDRVLPHLLGRERGLPYRRRVEYQYWRATRIELACLARRGFGRSGETACRHADWHYHLHVVVVAVVFVRLRDPGRRRRCRHSASPTLTLAGAT